MLRETRWAHRHRPFLMQKKTLGLMDAPTNAELRKVAEEPEEMGARGGQRLPVALPLKPAANVHGWKQ